MKPAHAKASFLPPLYQRKLYGKAKIQGLIPCGLLIFILLIAASVQAGQTTSSPDLWKVIMAEAVSEGYDGMYGVACVIRNRGGDLRGFAGTHRKDLDAFCDRQGKRYIEMAKRIETIVFKNNGRDITNGATHFENIQKFGIPYWAKKMDRVAVIGSHTFYKERRVYGRNHPALRCQHAKIEAATKL